MLFVFDTCNVMYVCRFSWQLCRWWLSSGFCSVWW